MSVEINCQSIVEQLLNLVNSGQKITLERDFGENTLTFIVEGKGHSHAGSPGGDFNQFAKSLKSIVHDSRWTNPK